MILPFLLLIFFKAEGSILYPPFAKGAYAVQISNGVTSDEPKAIDKFLDSSLFIPIFEAVLIKEFTPI